MARRSSTTHLRRRINDFRRVADETARREQPKKIVNRVIEALREFSLKLPERPDGITGAQYKYHRESIQAELNFIAEKLRQAK